MAQGFGSSPAPSRAAPALTEDRCVFSIFSVVRANAALSAQRAFNSIQFILNGFQASIHAQGSPSNYQTGIHRARAISLSRCSTTMEINSNNTFERCRRAPQPVIQFMHQTVKEIPHAHEKIASRYIGVLKPASSRRLGRQQSMTSRSARRGHSIPNSRRTSMIATHRKVFAREAGEGRASLWRLNP